MQFFSGLSSHNKQLHEQLLPRACILSLHNTFKLSQVLDLLLHPSILLVLRLLFDLFSWRWYHGCGMSFSVMARVIHTTDRTNHIVDTLEVT